MVHWCRLGLPHPVHLMLRDLSDCISVACKAIVLTTPTAMSKPNVRRLLGIRKKLFAVLSAPCSQNVRFVSPSHRGRCMDSYGCTGCLWQYHQVGVFAILSLPSLIWYYTSTDVVATSVASKAKKILEWSPGPWFCP